MVAIDTLIKKYNGQIAVSIDQLDIKQGDLIGIVGNNGAGKTTLFRLLLDLTKADHGKVFLKDKNVADSEEWKSYTAAYLDEGFLITYLTPYEYFYFVGKLHNMTKASVDEYLKQFDLFFEGALKNNKYIRDLSKGNQFKVGIAACLLQHPELLILDEPFANLDPSSQIRLMNMLKGLNEKKRMTILISSHDLNHITDLCRRILLMEKGFIIRDLQSDSETLKELEAYFKV
ncbi:MAG TPA: ABC transporter ATP-binding protein [Puia sp.]|nr:ABC transporter ATP-binding protein [Puia sp.]